METHAYCCFEALGWVRTAERVGIVADNIALGGL